MSALTIVQLVLALLLSTLILMQQRGVGLGGAFGGEGNVYRSRRGLEKTLFMGTIIIALLFFGATIASVVMP